MQIQLDAELQEKLTRLAAQQGRDSNALVVEAVERFVNYDAWFLRAVDEGLAAGDRGELIDHDEVARMIDRKYPG